MDKLLDRFIKHQKYFLALAIFLSLLAVSITISDGEITLNFRHSPIIMLIIMVVSILLVFAYISIDKLKIASLSQQIEAESKNDRSTTASKMSSLTSRQKEVYEHILAGKSNKEIMGMLFIEQSTLKSHINQIYRKLGIKSRKELKSK